MFRKIDIKDHNNSVIIEINKDKDLDLTNINIDKNSNSNNNTIVKENHSSSEEIVLSGGELSFNNNLDIVPVCREVNIDSSNSPSDSPSNNNNNSSSSRRISDHSFVDRLFKSVKNKTSRSIIVILVLVIIVVEEFASLLK